MTQKEQDLEVLDENNEEFEGVSSVWDLLSPQQKKYFRQLSEKTPEKMKYIG